MCTRNDSFRNSEWGFEEAEALAREVRPFKVPGGKDGKAITLGMYVDKTPRQQMSKVMLEEIVFKTWYGGRTVLLGDACHKSDVFNYTYMNPSGALGGIHAIHDAVALANWLSTLQLADDKNMLAVVVRGMMKRIPAWIWRRIICKMFESRPQCSFFPLIEDDALVKPSYQRSLHKTLVIHKELTKKRTVLPTGNSAPVTV
ncbi:hypothetical protein BGZ59_010234 [Podila verticillata]|nr:hypothetical protein BGZ59_010234 [Podila verticillata]